MCRGKERGERGKAQMMERTVPWWRRALKFALSGIRSGFGLFRGTGKTKPARHPSKPKAGLPGAPVWRLAQSLSFPERD